MVVHAAPTALCEFVLRLSKSNGVMPPRSVGNTAGEARSTSRKARSDPSAPRNSPNSKSTLSRPTCSTLLRVLRVSLAVTTKMAKSTRPAASNRLGSVPMTEQTSPRSRSRSRRHGPAVAAPPALLASLPKPSPQRPPDTAMRHLSEPLHQPHPQASRANRWLMPNRRICTRGPYCP